MDNKEYIKMCKDAEEIQGIWTPDTGDLVSSINSNEFEGYLIQNKDETFNSKRMLSDGHLVFGPLCNKRLTRKFYIWLPRADQIQNLIALKPITMMKQIKVADEVLTKLSGLGGFNKNQVWLRFYMWHAYKKLWNGKHWQRVEFTDAHTWASQSNVISPVYVAH